MSRRSTSTLALAMSLLTTNICSAQAAAEVSKETSAAQVEQCVAQHDSARRLRLEEQWQGARAATVSCADERCPLAIAADCRAWLDELVSLMPTVIVVVDIEDVAARHSTLRVELDGVPIELSEPPTPIELLPGVHRLRADVPGLPPVEREFTLETGEKNRIERVRFDRRATAPAPAPPPPPTRPVPTSTYWFSAGALAALASSAAFLVAGLKEHSDARDICAPNCGSSISRSIKTRLLLADVTGGAGLVLGGLAAYTYLRRPLVFSGTPPSGPAVSADSRSVSLLWHGQF